MLIKCICTNCSGHLEFEEENAGTIIKCPHCGWDTRLYEDGPIEGDGAETQDGRRLFATRRGLLACAGAGVLVLVAAGFVVNRWAFPWMEEHLPSIEGKLLQSLVLVVALFGTAVALAWAAFPVVLLFQFRKLNRLVQALLMQGRPALPVETIEQEVPETQEEETDLRDEQEQPQEREVQTN